MKELQKKIEYFFIDKESELYESAIDLRYREFYEKFNRTRESIFDEIEDKSLKIVACIDNKVIGHARLFIDNSIGEITQVVVEQNYRSLNIGANIVKKLIEESKKQSVEKIGLDARIYAIDFYKKLGFKTNGEIFESKKSGLPHIRMEVYL